MSKRASSKFVIKRGNRGVCLSEFPLALFLVLFLSFFPACNLVMFCSAYLSLQQLTQKSVCAISMCESREKAATSEKELLNNYRNPALTMLHHVHFEPARSPFRVEILVNKDKGKTEIYEQNLPEEKKPSYKDNRTKFLYTYRLHVTCLIDPIFNMGGIPVIGQVPIVATPSSLEFCAQAPVENLTLLEK